jgi:hypothetical protein
VYHATLTGSKGTCRIPASASTERYTYAVQRAHTQIVINSGHFEIYFLYQYFQLRFVINAAEINFEYKNTERQEIFNLSNDIALFVTST